MTKLDVILPAAKRQGLSDHVLDTLRQAIMTGVFRPGQWLVESVIAEQMQISRGPVREAIRGLQQEGLVTAVPGKGTRVTVLAEQDVRELHTLRALLEGHAVRQLCAESRRSKAVSKLRKNLERMHEAATARDMNAFSQLDFDFHRTILETAGMPRLFQLWSSLNGLLLIWLLSVQEAVLASLDDVLADHDDLANAIEDGDEVRASTLLQAHIVDRGEAILAVSTGGEAIARSVPPRRSKRRG